ncbi:hypothetical protein [Candidatus Galacturonibacter soehngenii]|uniref:hypothetical protein n=1 Tax=Candidatus Galacturonatibacter soehngenii TaxID=2307010 RepID=UPI00177ABD4A|nr:hypothetical protein [Candidatus Galacturonibacter soehngenii]
MQIGVYYEENKKVYFADKTACNFSQVSFVFFTHANFAPYRFIGKLFSFPSAIAAGKFELSKCCINSGTKDGGQTIAKLAVIYYGYVQ